MPENIMVEPSRWLNVRKDQSTSNPDIWLLIYGEDDWEGGDPCTDIMLTFNRRTEGEWLIGELRRIADELETLL